MHVSEKYPHADESLVDRFGTAMARQRAILKYRERHHAKLSKGIDHEEGRSATGSSAMLSGTVATDMYKDSTSESSDMVSDDGISETSYSGTLLDGTGTNTIPPLPDEGANQAEFECPYCFFIITIRDKRAWARHIFRDLMPYMCVFFECPTPNKLYESRRYWYRHIQQSHSHDLGSITDDSYDCPICRKRSLPVITFERHVGRHLEELALFLLPQTTSDEDKDTETDHQKEEGSSSIDGQQEEEEEIAIRASAVKSWKKALGERTKLEELDEAKQNDREKVEGRDGLRQRQEAPAVDSNRESGTSGQPSPDVGGPRIRTRAMERREKQEQEERQGGRKRGRRPGEVIDRDAPRQRAARGAGRETQIA